MRRGMVNRKADVEAETTQEAAPTTQEKDDSDWAWKMTEGWAEVDGLEKRERLGPSGPSNQKSSKTDPGDWAGLFPSTGMKGEELTGKEHELTFAHAEFGMSVDIYPRSVALGSFEYESVRSGERGGMERKIWEMSTFGWYILNQGKCVESEVKRM